MSSTTTTTCHDDTRRHRSHHHNHHRENPSFSSSLLDAIYRSFEDDTMRTTTNHKHGANSNSNSKPRVANDDDDLASFRRACMIEKWMEKKAAAAAEKNLIVRCKSMADRYSDSNDNNPVLLNSSSTSTSSDSSSSSAESDHSTLHSTVKSSSSFSSSSSTRYAAPRPKPIRTSPFDSYNNAPREQPKKQHREGGFVKTKSKALKIYSDLKKVKQPISPGGRLATFLNSVFSAKSKPAAKVNSCDSSKSENTSACSSASSFSRSCLSKAKTPSFTKNLPTDSAATAAAKRSVRFYPVSVIVDEDCRPCGHKNLPELEKKLIINPTKLEEELKIQNLLNNYRQNKNDAVPFQLYDVDDEDDEEDDDHASCVSSDLFELDNLSAIGIDELPVYETTHPGTNRAIANGLIV